ncbi:hypothetical protein NL676_039099 [Syzygium grande]|nr:hypothetical protein NL676_039099 [Syzygium grande]
MISSRREIYYECDAQHPSSTRLSLDGRTLNATSQARRTRGVPGAHGPADGQRARAMGRLNGQCACYGRGHGYDNGRAALCARRATGLAGRLVALIGHCWSAWPGQGNGDHGDLPNGARPRGEGRGGKRGLEGATAMNGQVRARWHHKYEN